MSETNIYPMTEQEMRQVRLTIGAMQHPNQLGMYAGWWIKWQRFSLWMYDLEDEYNKEAVKKLSRVEDLENALTAERAKVAALMVTIESQKQTEDALIKRCRELEMSRLAAHTPRTKWQRRAENTSGAHETRERGGIMTKKQSPQVVRVLQDEHAKRVAADVAQAKKASEFLKDMIDKGVRYDQEIETLKIKVVELETALLKMKSLIRSMDDDNLLLTQQWRAMNG